MLELDKLKKRNIPLIIIQIPSGSDLLNNKDYIFIPKKSSLLSSLEKINAMQVIKLRNYINTKIISSEKVCISLENCHPSVYGMNIYADAILKFLLEKSLLIN